jgi:hypothetical protein
MPIGCNEGRKCNVDTFGKAMQPVLQTVLEFSFTHLCG